VWVAFGQAIVSEAIFPRLLSLQLRPGSTQSPYRYLSMLCMRIDREVEVRVRLVKPASLFASILRLSGTIFCAIQACFFFFFAKPNRAEELADHLCFTDNAVSLEGVKKLVAYLGDFATS
jgi:hypothetical protein